MTQPVTHTLDVSGAVLHYDVRASDASNQPPLLLVGSPMGASGFGTLAGFFPDRTVVTYDPRGAERSVRTDDAKESTPDEHADDLQAVIAALDAGPVDIFASSGGAVNALALVTRHPAEVRTLVAHEPPAFQTLPDRGPALAVCQDIQQTYQHSGFGPAMAKFIAMVGHKGLIPSDYTTQAAPDPAMFGLPTEDDGSRSDALVGQNIITCTHYEHDFDAIRDASRRVVIGAGADSEGEPANRAAHAVADRLGTEAVSFPGNHGGFLSSEWGNASDPAAFAAKLREVLS